MDLKKYFSIGKNHSADSAFLKRAAVIVVSHLDDEHFSGNELAEKLCLSREQTHRKIKQSTSLSTGKFIRYIRILKAYGYLLEGNFSVSEISYKVGFEDPSYFNKCFKEEAGFSPGEVKKRGDLITLTKTPLFPFYELPEIKDQLQKNGIIFEFPHQAKQRRTVSKGWLIAGAIFSVSLLSLFFLPGKMNHKNKIVLGDSNRIVILPFTNRTGDSSLSGIGDMASSWLSNQLAELKIIQTVPYFTVRQYQSYIGIVSDDPEGRPTFGELVAARYMIAGDYYLKENQVYFNARFVDASTLKPVYDLPVMHGDKDSVMDVIERIRLKIAGLITNLDEVKLGKRKPPNYEAYNAFLTGLHQMSVGLSTPESRLYLEKAVALEPDFVMPRIFLSWFYQGKKLDSLMQQIAAIPTITKYEKNVYDQMCHLWNHDYKESLRLTLQYLEDYPGDYFFNLFAGHNAKSLFMPRLAIKVLDQIREPLPNNEGGVWHYYKVWNYTESLIMLGQYQDATDYLQSIPLEHYSLAVPHLLINVNVRLGKTSEEVEALIGKIGRDKMKYLTAKFNMDEQKVYADYYTAAAYEFYLAGNRETAQYFAKKAASLFAVINGQQAYKYDIADALYLSDDFRKTKNYLQKQLKKDPANDELLIYLAHVEAALGNEGAALKIFSKYDALSRIQWRRHEFQYQRDYLAARNFALLGKKDHAVSLLKRALEKGQLFHYHDFGRDMFLRSLFGYEPFQELIQLVDPVDSTIKQ
ncbi:MAG TPA: helix-turn-helix domain-containing protein [Chitinophagaceae bacterium]|nr:helix-turn-helix domain-containing protein [Chitinophagaceae bacterium]